MTVGGIFQVLVVLADGENDDGSLMNGFILRRSYLSLDFFSPSCADELFYWVLTILKGTKDFKCGSFAGFGSKFVGMDDGLPMLGEDGLSTAVIDVESQRSLS